MIVRSAQEATDLDFSKSRYCVHPVISYRRTMHSYVEHPVGYMSCVRSYYQWQSSKQNECVSRWKTCKQYNLDSRPMCLVKGLVMKSADSQ